MRGGLYTTLLSYQAAAWHVNELQEPWPRAGNHARNGTERIMPTMVAYIFRAKKRIFNGWLEPTRVLRPFLGRLPTLDRLKVGVAAGPETVRNGDCP